MNEKEQKAVDILKTGISWAEASQRTGLTEEKLKRLFDESNRVQQAKNEALAVAAKKQAAAG